MPYNPGAWGTQNAFADNPRTVLRAGICKKQLLVLSAPPGYPGLRFALAPLR
jgi:hypothetical protein